MKGFFVTLIAAISSIGFGQVDPIGIWWNPSDIEGFESHPTNVFAPSLSIFSGAATVNQITSGQGLLVTTGWSFFSNVKPHGGNAFMGGAGVNYEYIFNSPVLRFGGHFATNADVPGAVATFFDASNQQIGGALAIGAPLGQWQWDGWQSSVGIKRVSITANNSWGGFIMSDDLQYDAVPEPATFAATALGLSALIRRRRTR